MFDEPTYAEVSDTTTPKAVKTPASTSIPEDRACIDR